jgi:hypothetical protein
MGIASMGGGVIQLALHMSPNFVPVGYEGHVKQHVPTKNSGAWGGFQHCEIGRTKAFV